MEYIDLLGSLLKNDVLLDLFETYEVDVVYNYDRTHEGLDDEYLAEIPEMGLEFVFDSSQRLTTLFMKMTEHSGFNPFRGLDPRSAPFSTASEAMDWARERSIDAQYQPSQTDSIFGEISEWVKLNYKSYFLHYQFHGGAIEMVTLQLK